MSSAKKRKKGRRVSFYSPVSTDVGRSSLRTTHCNSESNFIKSFNNSPTPMVKSKDKILGDIESWLSQSVQHISSRKKSKTSRGSGSKSFF